MLYNKKQKIMKDFLEQYNAEHYKQIYQIKDMDIDDSKFKIIINPEFNPNQFILLRDAIVPYYSDDESIISKPSLTLKEFKLIANPEFNEKRMHALIELIRERDKNGDKALSLKLVKKVINEGLIDEQILGIISYLRKREFNKKEFNTFIINDLTYAQMVFSYSLLDLADKLIENKKALGKINKEEYIKELDRTLIITYKNINNLIVMMNNDDYTYDKERLSEIYGLLTNDKGITNHYLYDFVFNENNKAETYHLSMLTRQYEYLSPEVVEFLFGSDNRLYLNYNKKQFAMLLYGFLEEFNVKGIQVGPLTIEEMEGLISQDYDADKIKKNIDDFVVKKYSEIQRTMLMEEINTLNTPIEEINSKTDCNDENIKDESKLENEILDNQSLAVNDEKEFQESQESQESQEEIDERERLLKIIEAKEAELEQLKKEQLKKEQTSSSPAINKLDAVIESNTQVQKEIPTSDIKKDVEHHNTDKLDKLDELDALDNTVLDSTFGNLSSSDLNNINDSKLDDNIENILNNITDYKTIHNIAYKPE